MALPARQRRVNNKLIRPPARDVLVAVSLANLCYVPVWSEIFPPFRSANHYYLGDSPSAVGPIIAMGGMIALAVVIYIGARLARRWPSHSALRRLAVVAFLLIVAVAFNALWRQVMPSSQATRWVLSGLALIAVGAARTWGLERLARGMSTLVLVLLPFVVMTLGQAAYFAVRSASDLSSFRDKPAAQLLNTEPAARRLLFVVFDSLDQHILVDDRPAGLVLGEFERLWASAIHWRNAYPPSGRTLISLPTLITGKPITKADPQAANYLRIRSAEGGAERPWSEEPTLFMRARRLGLDAVLIGWYHPYCRIVGDQVTRCRSYPQLPNPPDTPGESLRVQLALLVDVIPGSSRVLPDFLRFGRLERRGGIKAPGIRARLLRWHADQYLAIRDEALRAAVDSRLEFVFVHYPVPHPPYVFNHETDLMRTTRGGSYADNLALTDRTLKELRLALQGAGLWERTTLIVTSDHWNRRPGWTKLNPPEDFPTIGRPDHRVPLILRLPSQREPFADRRPINAAAAYALALAILEGRLETPAQLEGVIAGLPAWMRLH
jgi:Sulfatase